MCDYIHSTVRFSAPSYRRYASFASLADRRRLNYWHIICTTANFLFNIILYYYAIHLILKLEQIHFKYFSERQNMYIYNCNIIHYLNIIDYMKFILNIITINENLIFVIYKSMCVCNISSFEIIDSIFYFYTEVTRELRTMWLLLLRSIW